MDSKLRNSRGSALLLSLMITIMLTMVVMMAVDRSTTDIEMSFNQLHEEQAFYIAAAGLKRAFKELDADTTWRTGYVDEGLGTGKYSVIVVDSATRPGLDDTILLISTGSVDEAHSNLQVTAVPKISQPFKYAAFGKDSVILRNTACTDSYNADSGYVASQLNESGDIGTGGHLLLRDAVTVNGDASTSSEGDIEILNTATVSGDTTSSAPQHDMVIVPESEYTWAESVNSAPAGFTGSYTYDPSTDELILSGSDTLVLSAGVYFFSSITTNNFSSLQIAPGEDVTIYLTDGIKLRNESSFNPEGSPSSLVIYAKGTGSEIGNSTEFRGAFLGPNTDLTIDNNPDVYGAFMVRSLELVNAACIHYDRNLSSFSRNEFVGYRQVAWREL